MSSPFKTLSGAAAPLILDNIDTDAIIPSRESQSVSRDGYSEKLFANWRYAPGTRDENPDFVLNRPPFRNAVILLAGRNFGCGSSRESATWSLAQFGIRCVIAASFGEIFRNNCVRNGILPVMLPAESIEALGAEVEAAPELPMEVDLEEMLVTTRSGLSFGFTIKPRDRQMLLTGLDEIALTLKSRPKIDAFREAERERRPWNYPKG